MPFDAKSALTHTTLYAAKSVATNNTATPGMDLRGYDEPLNVRVCVGVQTAGDNAMTFTTLFQSAANNTASEATNIGTLNCVTSGNNAATHSNNVQIDPRASGVYRYLFGRIVITAGNSPAAPISMEAVGVKKVQ